MAAGYTFVTLENRGHSKGEYFCYKSGFLVFWTLESTIEASVGGDERSLDLKFECSRSAVEGGVREGRT